jgi:hypothetical protein
MERRCRRVNTLVLVLAVSNALAVACGGTPTSSTANPIDLSNVDSGKTVSAVVGQEIDVTLQTIGPGSYGAPQISSSALRFLAVSLTGAPNPGGPRQLFRFESVTQGQAEIRVPHLPSRTPGTSAPFVVVVNVH